MKKSRMQVKPCEISTSDLDNTAARLVLEIAREIFSDIAYGNGRFEGMTAQKRAMTAMQVGGCAIHMVLGLTKSAARRPVAA